MLLFQFIYQEWDFYVQRFHRMFDHSENTEFHVVVGNHDISRWMPTGLKLSRAQWKPAPNLQNDIWNHPRRLPASKPCARRTASFFCCQIVQTFIATVNLPGHWKAKAASFFGFWYTGPILGGLKFYQPIFISQDTLVIIASHKKGILFVERFLLDFQRAHSLKSFEHPLHLDANGHC